MRTIHPLFVILLLMLATPVRAEVLFQYLDNHQMELEGKEVTTKSWTADEREKVDRYFRILVDIAPRLTAMIDEGHDLGPVSVVRAETAYWSIGFAKQTNRGETTYLILTDNFFKAYDIESADIGYDGGNYSLWFFVHEAAHLAELRTTSVGEELPSRDLTGTIGRTIMTKIVRAKVALARQGIDFKEYVFSTDRSHVDVIRDLGLPTKYALRTPNEALAEIVTATILAPQYQPPEDVRRLVDVFYGN